MALGWEGDGGWCGRGDGGGGGHRVTCQWTLVKRDAFTCLLEFENQHNKHHIKRAMEQRFPQPPQQSLSLCLGVKDRVFCEICRPSSPYPHPRPSSVSLFATLLSPYQGNSLSVVVPVGTAIDHNHVSARTTRGCCMFHLHWVNK